ncbi:MAG: ABC transporter ATP-binding protein [Pseudomonadota bacterium]
MIRLAGVRRVFHVGDEDVHALRDVDLQVAEGEYIAIMGPSGSGKSSLLNVIGLLDRPDAGTYELEGHNVTQLSDEQLASVRSQRIGFVFQFFHLVPRLTAAQNIELPMTLAGVAPAERQRRVATLLREYGLEDRADHRPSELSGGQSQRVAIARALAMEPRLLLADEPTGNLDRHTGLEVMALLERFNAGGGTLLLVTHDPELGARARRRLRMVDGNIVDDERRTTATG